MGNTTHSRELNEYWNSTCPKCNSEQPMDIASMDDIIIEHGEFVAITQHCPDCGYKAKSFYDWDRTVKKEE